LGVGLDHCSDGCDAACIMPLRAPQRALDKHDASERLHPYNADRISFCKKLQNVVCFVVILSLVLTYRSIFNEYYHIVS